MSKLRQRMIAILLHNGVLKLLAVVLAVLSFYGIRNAISFEVPYNVPIDVQVEKGIAVLEQHPRTVDVIFRGAQDSLRHLDQQRIRAVVRLKAESGEGSVTLPVGPANIDGAPDVRVIDVRPGAVTVTLDRETRKQVPVVMPKTIGRPLAGTANIEYEPRVVVLRGSARRLQDVDSVQTELVDVDRRIESFSEEVRVLPPGWVSEIEPRKVTVRISIVADLMTRELTNCPLLAVAEPGAGVDAYFEPATVNVTLKGTAAEVGNVAEKSVQAFVNCAWLDPSHAYELPVLVHLPESRELRAVVEPKSVKVTLRRR